MTKFILIVCLLSGISLRSFTQTLEFYLNKGIKNSPLLHDFENQISASTYDSLLVIASHRPQVTGNASLLYAPSFQNNRYGYDDVVTNGGTYSATIGVQQRIFDRKSLSVKYRDLQLQKQSALNSQKLSVSELKRSITNQYLTVYSEYKNLSFNKDFLKLMHDEKDLLKAMVAKGIYKQTDYLTLSIESQSQEIQVNQISALFIRDEHLLNQLCGINDSVQLRFFIPELAIQKGTDSVMSPLFMQYRIDSLRIANQKAVIDARYLPRLSWTADVGFLSSALYNVYHHYGFSIGLSLDIPIYDGHQRKLEHQKLALSEDTRSDYASFFRTQYSQQVLQYDAEIKSNDAVISQLQSQLGSARELMVLARAQLNAGNLPITEFINAVRNYNTINSNLTQAQVKQLQFINELNYLLQ